MSAIDRKLRRQSRTMPATTSQPIFGGSAVGQIKRLSREVLKVLKEHDWPNAELVAGRAGWKIAPYSYWAGGEMMSGGIYMRSNGSFARDTPQGALEVFSLRLRWVRAYDESIILGLIRLRDSLQ